jgi:hypothetical protein
MPGGPTGRSTTVKPEGTSNSSIGGSPNVIRKDLVHLRHGFRRIRQVQDRASRLTMAVDSDCAGVETGVVGA